jgi:hypothetical protein
VRKAPSDREVIATITRLGGDGYVPLNDVLLELRVERRAGQRGVRRAVNQGYVLERRGPDGRLNLAVASDGWGLVDAA